MIQHAPLRLASPPTPPPPLPTPQAGASLNEFFPSGPLQGMTPLGIAAAFGLTRVAEALLLGGADPNVQTMDPKFKLEPLVSVVESGGEGWSGRWVFGESGGGWGEMKGIRVWPGVGVSSKKEENKCRFHQ